MDVTEFFMRQRLETELQMVRAEVTEPPRRGGEKSLWATLGEAERSSAAVGREAMEEVRADVGSPSVVLPSLQLSTLDGPSFRRRLQQGYARFLSKEDKKILQNLLPAGITAEDLLNGANLLFGNPVEQFFTRVQLGLLHPAVQEHRQKLPALAARVAKSQIERNAVVAAEMKKSFDLMQRYLAIPRSILPTAEPDDDIDTAETEYVAATRPAPAADSLFGNAAAVQQALARKRPRTEAPLVVGIENLGVALDPSHTNLTRQQKKTQSRIINNQFLSSFNVFLRIRELLRKAPVQMSEFIRQMAADPTLLSDPVEGYSSADLARLSVLYLTRHTVCHKSVFGPYVSVNQAGIAQWIDDSKYDDLDVFLDLESAERLFRYAMSRRIIDDQGIISSAALKNLKNNPLTVNRLTQEQLRDFHRQERERYALDNAPYRYTLPYGSFCVAPQRIKAAKVLRKHQMLLDDRPAAVTLQDVVRDALARLPQGVGTKSDIQLLILDSQYVHQNVSSTVVSNAVSDCLDRLSAVADPAAAYHGPSRLWSHLHRNRQLHEFEAE